MRSRVKNPLPNFGSTSKLYFVCGLQIMVVINYVSLKINLWALIHVGFDLFEHFYVKYDPIITPVRWALLEVSARLDG